MNEQATKRDLKVGDWINFQDANDPALGHGGHDIIGFDQDGNPQVECAGKTLTVKPEQIRAVGEQ